MKPHGRPADVCNLACFLLELTVGVPSQDTLLEKVCECYNYVSPCLMDIFVFYQIPVIRSLDLFKSLSH